MNKKGFTLTELLVVVIILGIVAGISIPLIRNLSTGFEKKKYQNYAEAVLTSAKAFNDSYTEDLFGHNEYGCAYIPYEKLVERKLLKDIEIDGVTCNSNKTYIRVIKQKDKYAYKTYLTCGKKKEDGTMGKVYTSIPTEIPEMDTDACTGVSSGNLSVTADMTQANGKADKVKKKTRIKIASGTGIDNTIVLYAKWSQNSNDHDNAGFAKVDFKVKDNQEESLLNGEIISTQSKELLTPDGNGAYYLIVRVDHLQDLYGHKWKNPDNTDSKYLSFGPFVIDSTSSTINTVVYKCDANGNKVGNALTNKKVTSGSGEVLDLTNIAGNVSGWLTSASYANGVCLGFEINDNLSIKSVKLEQNTPGKQANASGYKTLDSSKTWTESYDSGVTSKVIYKQIKEDGHRYLRFTIKDYAGHTTSMDVEFKMDKTPPTKPVINNPSGGKWVNTDVKLTLSSSDALIGMGEYYYTYNENASATGTNSGTEWVKLNGGTNQTSFTTEPWTNNIDKTVYIRSCDKLGNCSVKNSTPIKIDKTAPAIPTIDNPSRGEWVYEDYRLDIRGKDTAEGINTCSEIADYYYSYNATPSGTGDNDNSQWVKLAGGTGQTYFTTQKIWSTAVGEDFNKTTYVRVCDNAGNCSDSSNTPIKIDKKAPTVPIVSNPSGGNWTNTDFKVTLKSSDSGVGLKDYQLSYNENANTVGSDKNTQWISYGSNATETYETTNFSAQREQYAYFRVCDKLNNCSDKNKTMIKIDKTDPTCGSVSKTNTGTTSGVDGTVACSDGGTYKSGCTKSSFSFSDKKATGNVTIKDNAGNTKGCQVTITDYDCQKYQCGTKKCNCNTTCAGSVLLSSEESSTSCANNCRSRGLEYNGGFREGTLEWNSKGSQGGYYTCNVKANGYGHGCCYCATNCTEKCDQCPKYCYHTCYK